MRPLTELGYFKANELKCWLLYVGPVILPYFIGPVLYHRFMLLSYSIRLMLLCSQYADKGGQLIREFIERTIELHGEESVS